MRGKRPSGPERFFWAGADSAYQLTAFSERPTCVSGCRSTSRSDLAYFLGLLDVLDHVLVRLVCCIFARLRALNGILHDGFDAEACGETWVREWILAGIGQLKGSGVRRRN
jgi:hypothetical protein